MFINLGTITAAANEAELAGVMGHEMAHVYMQHSAKQAGKAQTTSVLAGIASIALGAATGGIVGQLGQMGIQMGAQGVMLRYSRSDESEADRVGTIILYKVGGTVTTHSEELQCFPAALKGSGATRSDHCWDDSRASEPSCGIIVFGST